MYITKELKWSLKGCWPKLLLSQAFPGHDQRVWRSQKPLLIGRELDFNSMNVDRAMSVRLFLREQT